MKIMTILGTRPEGIKMAPVIRAIKQDAELECVFVNTAQHREMLDEVIQLFDIKPNYDLNMMQPGQKVEKLIGLMFSKLSIIIQLESPDLILVHGDTSTTFVGAYAAYMQKIPVGHVEAGLRTNNIYSPFPEEMNRQMVGRIATYHFAATVENKQNLLNESVDAASIHVVGNTVIDALLEVISRPFYFENPLKDILSNGLKTILLTTHRRENFDELNNVYNAINRILYDHPDVQIIFPVHKNPHIREKVKAAFLNKQRIHIIEPLNYEKFAQLMKQSFLIITDSGGIQEEAPSLGKPVLVAREATERQEGVNAGTLKLVGTCPDTIYQACSELITSDREYEKMTAKMNPFGTGKTAEKIVTLIKNELYEKDYSSNDLVWGKAKG